MGLLRHIRSRSKVKSLEELQPYPKPCRPAAITRLPKPILSKVFNYVCPHTMDESYSDEGSLEGCGLCDLRDLAHCALVNRAWYLSVQDVLYHSVRIDAVHYCPLEEIHSATRKRKHIDPSDVFVGRLCEFQRTVWYRHDIASAVLFFKLPYMARETYKVDLARIVSALPNVRHVDLPDSFFSADPSTHILRKELEANCWDIRRMAYKSGAEIAFQNLGQRTLWKSMGFLELDRLNIDIATLRHVLAHLPALQDLRLSSLARLDDTAFQATPSLPPFPAVQRLTLANAPRVTSAGITSYLHRPEVREVLSSLFLHKTGISTSTLHTFLSAATHLILLSVIVTVADPFPFDPVPALSSKSLRKFNYELSSPDDAPSLASSHYAYLCQSLLARTLPSLRELYVLDTGFAESLQAAPCPPRPVPQKQQHRFSSTNPFAKAAMASTPPPRTTNPFEAEATLSPTSTLPVPKFRHNAPFRATDGDNSLSIYAKAPGDSTWSFSSLPAAPPSQPYQATLRTSLHPNSSAHLRANSDAPPPLFSSNVTRRTASDAPAGWRSEARKSVFMPSRDGGFLAVPGPEDQMPRGRSGNAGGEEDAWPVGVGGAGDWERGMSLGDGGGLSEKERGHGKGKGSEGKRSSFWRKGSVG